MNLNEFNNCLCPNCGKKMAKKIIVENDIETHLLCDCGFLMFYIVPNAKFDYQIVRTLKSAEKAAQKRKD